MERMYELMDYCGVLTSLHLFVAVLRSEPRVILKVCKQVAEKKLPTSTPRVFDTI